MKISYLDDEFVKSTSIFYKIWYLNVSTTMERFKYYFAWIFSDAICNNAGFGFNGFDENGKARWNLMTNVNLWEVEVIIFQKYTNSYLTDAIPNSKREVSVR